MFSLYPDGGDMPTIGNVGRKNATTASNQFMDTINQLIKQHMEEDHEEATGPEHTPRYGNTDDVGA